MFDSGGVEYFLVLFWVLLSCLWPFGCYCCPSQVVLSMVYFLLLAIHPGQLV